MDKEITEDDYEILRQHFSMLDKGNKGYLDEADLVETLLPSDRQPQDAVTQLVKQLDADKDGRVNMYNLTIILAAYCHSSEKF